ncbi:MAG: hypothetical protein GBAus27B_000324 [Mycoplasmataceae bacterium]|nr:MAG: hypothetical protein GBAus27B_000324 [Mycoplasmataceae bacterium]
MSATFATKPFSVSSSHPREVYLVNKFEPEYLQDKDGNFLTQKNENGQEVKIEKWEKERTQIFLKSTEDEWKINRKGEKEKQLSWEGLTEEQKDFLDGNNIFYVPFNRGNQNSVTMITKKVPLGSLFFANPDHEMGFTPYIHNANYFFRQWT